VKETNGRYYSVPIRNRRNLDFCGLRGRRIAREAEIRFGPFTPQIYLILNPDGTSVGGNPQRFPKL